MLEFFARKCSKGGPQARESANVGNVIEVRLRIDTRGIFSSDFPPL